MVKRQFLLEYLIMVVRNVSPNLVERLQMMNPKSFIDLYDDGLKAEEIENEKKKNTRST